MRYSKMMECINKLIANKSLKLDGVNISSKMQSAIELWDNLYRNKAPWASKEIEASGLPAAIASEIARLVTLELKLEISGSPRAEYIDDVFKNVLKDIRKQTEYGCAKGNLIFKPYMALDRVTVQYNQADSFFPIAFDSNGEIVQCAFTEQFTKGRDIYTRVELHSLGENKVIINNFAYLSHTCEVLGTEVPLTMVGKWADIETQAGLEGADRLLVGFFKVPLANTIDPDSPLGVSVFARAAELIKVADKRYSQIDWEYDSKETAIHIATQCLKYNKGTDKLEYPGGKSRLYRNVEYASGATDKPLIDPFSPDIRDASYFHGYNQQLKRIEFDCGLAYGTLSDAQEVEKTAEEIRSSKQRSYVTVSDIQQALQRALEDLAYAIDYWVTIGGLAPAGIYKMSFDWDDSIITDNELERQQDRQDVSMGVMQLWEYRAKWYGETEEKAKSMIPEQADTVNEGA